MEKGEGLEFYIGETWRSNSSGEDLQRLILVADNMEEKEEWLKVMEEDFRFLISGLFSSRCWRRRSTATSSSGTPVLLKRQRGKDRLVAWRSSTTTGSRLCRSVEDFQSGTIDFQSDIIDFQSGITDYQSGIIDFQSGVIEIGILSKWYHAKIKE